MIKIRLQGTVSDLHWFREMLMKSEGVLVTDCSQIFPNKGTNRFFRMYMEAEKYGLEKKDENYGEDNCCFKSKGRMREDKCNR